MNEIRSLLVLELRSLYGINQFLHTKDPKAKKRCYLLLGAWVILIATVFAYVGGLAYGLCALGMGDIVPMYLTALASLLIVAFGFFTAGNRIFGRKGYDLLASMPVKSSSIVVSRFLAMYAEDLVLTLVVLLPGVAVYGVCTKPGPGFYLTALLGGLLIPAIPLVAATLLGSLVLALSSRMKHKSIMQSVLMVGLVIAVMVGSFRMGPAMEEMTPEAFASLAVTIRDLFGQMYPPALWLGDAMAGGDLMGLGLFALVSLGILVLALLVVTANFQAIKRRLQSFTAKHDYKLGAMQSRGLRKALYLREAKRYFSSSVYVTNTIVGPILGCILAVALGIVGLDGVQSYLQLPLDLTGLLPFVFAGVFCMMTTTATAISMEGRQFWVVKSLPIPTKDLLDSKILLNLSLMLSFYLVSVAAMAIGLKPGFWELVWLILIPGAVMVFSVVFGITVNLKLHSFDWEKEETIVKQSASAALGGFAGFFLAAGMGVAVFLIPAEFGNPARALMCLVLLAVTALLYRKNNRVELHTLS